MTDLRPNEMLALLAANMPRLKAEKILDEGDIEHLDAQGVYDLVLQATGSERQADEARRARTAARRRP